jgi:LuxR family maltose regulon positive regulatory protein
MIRLFLDEGKAMEDALRKLKNNVIHMNNTIPDNIIKYIDSLLAGFKPNLKSRISEAEEILSKREIEILQFIQNGATNSEISEKLFVSINTVKTHLLNIYTKLDVHSRTRAVVKAKDLKLI